jgi:hypothetical protein
MASSPRTRAVVVATGILIAAPAAQAQDTPPPPKAEPVKADAPPPPKARPLSAQPPQRLTEPPPPPPPVEARPRGKRPPPPPAATKGRWKKGKQLPALEGLPIANAPAFFRLDDGSTRISVECEAKVDIGEHHAQGRLVYRLKGARVMQRTNQLPLVTSWFATPVERAQLVQNGNDVDLVIELREATTPAFRAVETPRGIVIQVDFPKSVAAAERAANRPETSRERASRRATTQTLGTDRRSDDGSQNTGN